MLFLQRVLPCIGFLVLSALVVAGCNTKKDEDKPTSKPTEVTGDPRIGEGDLYHTDDETHHVRLKVDREKNEVRALLLDGKAKKIEPIDGKSLKLFIPKTKVDFVLEAKPEKGDGDGKCSVFVAKADGLPKDYNKKNVKMTTEIGGKSYEFKFDDEH
jgi:hypothetical protein